MSQANAAAARAFYESVSRGDVPAVLGMMAPDIQWHEAEGFPYADRSPYTSPDAVLQGVFLRLATEWEGFAAAPEEFFDAGNTVTVTGRYRGVYKATGRGIHAQFAHLFTFRDGKIVRFQQYTDTAQVARAASS